MSKQHNIGTSFEDRLQRRTLQKRLEHSIFATNVVLQETVDSTNSYAKDLAAQGAPEGTLVLAEEQTAGKGRMGRIWLSPRYANLLFSVVLRPPIPTDEVFVLTMISGLAVIEGVREVSGLRAMIKWPNDLYVDRKKLGGILTEFSVEGKAVEYVVLGIGLNVNWHPGKERGILYLATSISAETGHKAPRNDLLIEILRSFEVYYEKVLAGKRYALFERWNEVSLIMGEYVEIELGNKKINGKVLRIDHNGALVIEDRKGRQQRILSGDVSVNIGDLS